MKHAPKVFKMFLALYEKLIPASNSSITILKNIYRMTDLPAAKKYKTMIVVGASLIDFRITI